MRSGQASDPASCFSEGSSTERKAFSRLRGEVLAECLRPTVLGLSQILHETHSNAKLGKLGWAMFPKSLSQHPSRTGRVPLVAWSQTPKELPTKQASPVVIHATKYADGTIIYHEISRAGYRALPSHGG